MGLARRPAIAALFLLLLLVSGRQLSSPDLAWHLEAGEQIVKGGRIPRTDDFSYTVRGNQWWVNQPLAELLFYGVEKAAGPPGLILLRMAVVSGIFLLLLGAGRLAGGENEFLAAGVLLLALLAGSSHFLVRPFLLSALLLAFTGYAAEAYRRRRWRGVYALPAVFAVWALVHPGFLYGAAVLGSWIAGEWLRRRFRALRGDAPLLDGAAWKRFALVSAASLAAALLAGAMLNPSGVEALLLPVGLLKTRYFFSVLNEFQPANPIRDRFFALLFLLAALSFVPRRRRDASEMLALLVFGLFAFRAVRVILPFAVVAAPIAMRNLTPLAGRLLPGSSARGRIAGIAGALALLFFVSWWWRADPYRVPLPGDRGALGATWPWARVNYPLRAFDFLDREKLPGEVFHVDRYGGPFIRRFYPERRDFIDGRVEVYGETFWRDVYFRVLGCQPGWEDVLRRYDVNTTLLRIGTPAGGDPVSEAVQRLSSWALVYFDDDAMIHVRRSAIEDDAERLELVDIDPVTGAAPASYEEEVLARSGLARTLRDGRSQRALLFGMELDAARKRWTEVAAVSDSFLVVRGKSAFRYALYRLRGEARFRIGNPAAAEQDWKRAGGSPEAKNDLSLLAYVKSGRLDRLAPDAKDRGESLARLAGLLGDAGLRKESVEVAREALRAAGGRPELRNGLAWSLLEAGAGGADAIQEARQAVRERPNDGYARGTLGRALAESGDRAGARAEMERAILSLPAEDYRAAAAERARLASLLAEGEGEADRAEAARRAIEALRLDPETPDAPSLTRLLVREGRADSLAALSLAEAAALNRADIIDGHRPIEDRGRYIFMEGLKHAGLPWEEIERLSAVHTPRTKSPEPEGGADGKGTDR